MYDYYQNNKLFLFLSNYFFISSWDNPVVFAITFVSTFILAKFLAIVIFSFFLKKFFRLQNILLKAQDILGKKYAKKNLFFNQKLGQQV